MMDDYYDLGPYSRAITTRSAEAQLWFTRGLNWCYAFHHEEALRCFKKVVEHDPDCAMGYWGIAYAVGPYYNIPWEKMSPSGQAAALELTYENSQQAIALSEKASPVEAALCHAFAAPVSYTHLTLPTILRV